VDKGKNSNWEQKMRTRFILITFIIVLTYSCDTHFDQDGLKMEEQVKYDSMLVGFNDFFREIAPEDDDFKEFTNISFKVPNFPPGFYTDDELKAFYFFNFYNENYESTIAIRKDSVAPYHEVYSLSYLEPFYYIDFSNNIYSDFSFINNYGFEIHNVDDDFSGVNYTDNLFDSRLIAKWKSDSVSVNISDYLKSIEFRETYFLRGNTTIEYIKLGRQILNKGDSTLLFTIVGLSDNHLVLSYSEGEKFIIQYFTASNDTRHSAHPTEE